MRNKIRLKELLNSKIQECRRIAIEGGLRVSYRSGQPADFAFYSMINQSMNYWPRDDIVVESILASVSCLPSREGESFCEMFLEKREGDCLLKKLEGLSHLGLTVCRSTLRL